MGSSATTETVASFSYTEDAELYKTVKPYMLLMIEDPGIERSNCRFVKGTDIMLNDARAHSLERTFNSCGFGLIKKPSACGLELSDTLKPAMNPLSGCTLRRPEQRFSATSQRMGPFALTGESVRGRSN